jgi:hypothetical protein
MKIFSIITVVIFLILPVHAYYEYEDLLPQIKVGDSWKYAIHHKWKWRGIPYLIGEGFADYIIREISSRSDTTFIKGDYVDSLSKIHIDSHWDSVSLTYVNDTTRDFITSARKFSATIINYGVKYYEEVVSDIDAPFLTLLTHQQRSTSDRNLLISYHGDTLEGYRRAVDFVVGNGTKVWLQNYGIIQFNYSFMRIMSATDSIGTVDLVQHNGIPFDTNQFIVLKSTSAINASHPLASLSPLTPGIFSNAQFAAYLQKMQQSSALALFTIQGRCLYQSDGHHSNMFPSLCPGKYFLRITGGTNAIVPVVIK